MFRAVVPLTCALALPAGALTAQAVPTTVVVHVVAHDAKLVGSAVGGAHITITNAATGEVLAQGIHTGGTGDTQGIMIEPRVRDSLIFDTEGAAVYRASIPLTEPTLVRIRAHGPLAYPEAAATASTTVLLIPGQHIAGDGVVLDLHGYIVEITSPQSPRMARSGRRVTVQARVRMLCSCPTGEGELWRAGTVLARFRQGEEATAAVPLAGAGGGSLYAGELTVPAAGSWLLEVTAADPARANFGMARTTFIAQP